MHLKDIVKENREAKFQVLIGLVKSLCEYLDHGKRYSDEFEDLIEFMRKYVEKI